MNQSSPDLNTKTLADWLDFIERLHPREIELGLDRVRAAYQQLQPDVPRFKTISVAGTNGKGSVVALLENILLHAGYKVGAYTSPHLVHHNERIRVNGTPVEDANLCHAFAQVERSRGDIPLTYFEFGTLAALKIFADAALDIVILEVGMGGRLDAVNIIDADVAIVTSVGLDHVAWLGNDLETIGREKAGIFRPHRPAICAQDDPPESIAATAKELGAQCYMAGKDFEWLPGDNGWTWRAAGKQRTGLPLPLMRGRHQMFNAAAVLMALELLSADFPVSQHDIREGLANTSLPARFQVLPGQPVRILDVAHNVEAVAALAENLSRLPSSGRTLAVVAMMKDKPMAGMFAKMASSVDKWYLCAIEMARAASVDQLKQAMIQAGIAAPCQKYGSVMEAWQAAQEQALPQDRIVVFGSFYAVGGILGAIHETKANGSTKR